jgi:subtilisin family serine protease
LHPLEVVRLTALMARTEGNPRVKVGLIDGPVFVDHPDLAKTRIEGTGGSGGFQCTVADGISCLHATFVAGILFGKRSSPAPAICPGCTLLVRPIFSEAVVAREPTPRATPLDLADALVECINRGACVVNLSLALVQPSLKGEAALLAALDRAARVGVLVVAAAGNQGALSSSVITRHPWTIPVVACDLSGRPMAQSNLCASAGRRGLSSPGDNVRSLGAEGASLQFTGTSISAPFVTGTIALLWSEFPAATAAEIKRAITGTSGAQRSSVVPPLLDAASAYRVLGQARRQSA